MAGVPKVYRVEVRGTRFTVYDPKASPEQGMPGEVPSTITCSLASKTSGQAQRSAPVDNRAAGKMQHFTDVLFLPPYQPTVRVRIRRTEIAEAEAIMARFKDMLSPDGVVRFTMKKFE